MGKLVRDRIPEIIQAADGNPPDVRVLDATAFEVALLDKLVEETQELRDAEPAERLEEAADVYEVLLAITDLIGVDFAEVVVRADAKRRQRGGFRDRLWLEM